MLVHGALQINKINSQTLTNKLLKKISLQNVFQNVNRGTNRIESGNEFHNLGAHTAKDRSP